MKLYFKLFAAFTLAVLGYGFYQAMFAAPTEATMGDVQRIFYYHLPHAWTAFLLFFANFLASVWYLIRRSRGADALALASAEVGVVFCTVVLVTGPLWARPVWGIWWTWDARLTSTLVLWLIYVSYLVLRRFATGGQTQVLAAALAVFGFLDVPIVYLSIRYFRTQHPQPVIAGGAGSGLDPHMWAAVLWNLAGFMCLAVLLVALRYRLAQAEEALEEAHADRALEAPAGLLRIDPASAKTALAGDSGEAGDTARSA
jgi:heme exporter protein C